MLIVMIMMVRLVVAGAGVDGVGVFRKCKKETRLKTRSSYRDGMNEKC